MLCLYLIFNWRGSPNVLNNFRLCSHRQPLFMVGRRRSHVPRSSLLLQQIHMDELRYIFSYLGCPLHFIDHTCDTMHMQLLGYWFGDCCLSFSSTLKKFVVIYTAQTLNGKSYCWDTSIQLVRTIVAILVRIPMGSQTISCHLCSKLLLVGVQHWRCSETTIIPKMVLGYVLIYLFSLYRFYFLL